LEESAAATTDRQKNKNKDRPLCLTELPERFSVSRLGSPEAR
jgi:hypothetical protein